ncbi:hypothetical protein F2Q70_00002733 [Brassica cretica]|uniref:Uncharacterized protein n=1 Tax=Brassica cretica TaxID=69181 RepID=A0A8S9J0I8_BRACR|nr:hypothetical protein F2Q70_00002733 [Brassica cretica]
MRPGSGQDIFHCLALILGKLLIEVPVGEQASLESRDGSGDAASGNGHLLLIEAGYVASQGFLPMLEDFVEAIIGLLQVLAMDLEGRLIYHCRAGLVRVEPNPFHIVASRGPFGSATASILCLYWATWSSGSVAPSYAFMLGKENFLRILIKVILSVKGVSVYESGLLFRMGAIDLEGRLIYHCRAGPVRVEPNPFHIVASRGPFGSATASILCLYWATWSSGSVAPSYAFMLGKENFLRILIKVILFVKGVLVYESGLLFRMGGATPGSLSTCAKVHSRVLEKTSDGLYEIVQHRAEPLKGYLARFNQEKVAIFECSIPTAISAFKRGLLPDGDLYKELTKYQCKTMEDVLSQAWAQVNWEEDVASRAKAQQKQDTKTIRSDQTDRDEKPSQRPARESGNRNRSRYKNRHIEKAVSTWPDISHLSVSSPELINVLREDCLTLKIKVNELLKKLHLREFLSEKAKSHLSKETTGKPAEAAPVSSPRQDRVIHVISGNYSEGKDQGLIAITE